VLVTALEEGFDLASGLHNLLRDEADLAAVAAATGRSLHDVRVPSVDYPSPTASAHRQADAGRRHRLLGRQDVHRALHGPRDAGARPEGDLPRHRGRPAS
jgi:hypothetical protein